MQRHTRPLTFTQNSVTACSPQPGSHLGHWFYESTETFQSFRGTDFIQGCINYLMDFCFVSCVYFGQSAEAAAAYARRMNLAYWMTDVVEKIFGLLVFSSKFCQVWKSRKKYPLSMKRKTRADLVKQHEVKPKCKYHIWVGCCCKKNIYIYILSTSSSYPNVAILITSAA